MPGRERSADQGQIIHKFPVHYLARGCILRLQLNRPRLDIDDLRSGTDLQGEIDTRILADFDRDAFPAFRLEPAGRCRDRILCRRQLTDHVAAAGVACSRVGKTFLRVRCLDLDTGNQGARRIGNCSANRTGVELSACRPGHHAQDCGEPQHEICPDCDRRKTCRIGCYPHSRRHLSLHKSPLHVRKRSSSA